MGNVTYTAVADVLFTIGGNRRLAAGTIQMSTTYATGGDAFNPVSATGLTAVSAVIIASQPGGYLLEYTSNKIKAYLPSGSPTLSGEAAHTHAVALDGGATDAEAAHTHAVALDSGASAAGSAHNHTASASTVNPRYQVDVNIVAKPTIALTHNADPATNLLAAPLYIIEADGEATTNNGRLESTTNGNADVLGETANGTVGGVAASCRFWVKDNNTPAGVPIYINESATDQLEFVSPTDTDAYIIMPFEGAAGAPPGCAVAVKVHDSDTAATGKALYFDDNGAADAQLAFIDAGTAGGTIPAADVIVLTPTYIGPAADNIGVGSAEAQAIATENAHTHAYGTLADAASGTGSSHTHAYGTLADAASGTGSSHTHTATAETADEVGAGVNLSAITGVPVVIIGV